MYYWHRERWRRGGEKEGGRGEEMGRDGGREVEREREREREVHVPVFTADPVQAC